MNISYNRDVMFVGVSILVIGILMAVLIQSVFIAFLSLSLGIFAILHSIKFNGNNDE